MVQIVECIHALPIFDGLRVRAEGALLSLRDAGIFKRGGAVSGKKRMAGYIVEMMGFEEPVFGFALRLKPAAFADVLRLNVSGHEFGANHEKSMTFDRVFLRTQQSKILAFELAQHALDARRKAERLAAFAIVHHAIRPVGLRIIRPPAQFLTKEQVTHTRFAQPLLKFRLAKVRETETPRAAPNVSQKAHLALSQCIQKGIRVRVGVPDSV
jgi:hypothetical protein